MSALTIPVQIKTASASGQTPTSLLPGELGLDPWLGRLWWADNNGVKQFASLPSIAAGAVASDLNVAQQNILYQGLLIAALRGVPTGLVDGVLDPYSSTTDINTAKSSGYTFNSGAGTIGATPDPTKALLHFDGANGSTTFTDVAGHTFSIAAGSPTISTAQSVFGGASLRLPAGASITTPGNTDFAIGTGDFTVEFRLRTDAAGQFNIMDTRASATGTQNAFLIATDANSRITVYDAVAQSFVLTGGTALSANTQYAVAVSRVSGTLRVFINGAVDGSVGNASNFGTNQLIYIGTSNNNIACYIDEFRFSPGLGRYSAAYTPATAAFGYGPSALVLQSATLASAVASPSAMRALIQVDSTSAALTPNTDLIVSLSRDGGTTFTQGTLALVQTMPDGTAVYDTGWLSVAGQPTGNSTMTYVITTPTQKAIVLTGVSMQVKP